MATRKRELNFGTSSTAKFNRPQLIEYMYAFKMFDKDNTGFIEMGELAEALAAVQSNLEANSPTGRKRFIPKSFAAGTLCWICARFGDGLKLNQEQFAEVLDYVQSLKEVWTQIDIDKSGFLDAGELYRAFQLSDVNISQDTALSIATQFGLNSNGTLEFDEYAQMRLEWDCYISCWNSATGGNLTIPPVKLLQVLEEIKNSMIPVRLGITHHSQLPTLSPSFASQVAQAWRPFNQQTCEWLIIRFGGGRLELNFAQFATLLTFLKDLKIAFTRHDTSRSGSLGVTEMAGCLEATGLHLPADLVVQIGRLFDRDNSGAIEFDEFVQMAVEWHEMLQERTRLNLQQGALMDAKQVQEMCGHVRVIYRVVNGEVQGIRPFSMQCSRWLVATFGTVRPGESFAQSLTWEEWLHLVQYLKEMWSKYCQCDISQSGAVTSQELWLALTTCDIHLPMDVVENLRRCFDLDCSGHFEFDEFLQLVVECSLYNQVFEKQLRDPSTQSVTSPHGSDSSPGPSFKMASKVNQEPQVVLNRSKFFQMVFSVPRNI